MLNVDFSINPLTNRRQIAVNGAEERLSECCGSRDIPLEEWKGNCFEVLTKKYNDDVLSVSFTGMAKDFRFLSYLKNGAETEKKLQITLTEKTVYEPERLYRELGEAIREYDASEYDFLHEEYRKIAGGTTEIVFLTPDAGWTSDRLKTLLYDSHKNEYYTERKVTVVDAATADSLPEPEHALYYIHLCDLAGTAFKKSKQYLEKIRSLLDSRSRRTLPDTFFLCEYDFESEEFEDLCDRIDSVLKENTIPLLAFNRESVSEEVKKTTETFFGDYVFGGCLLGYFTQINDSLSKPIRENAAEVEKLKQEIEAAEKELRDLQEQREALRKEKEQYREIPKILDRKRFEEQLCKYLDRYNSESNSAYCIQYHERTLSRDWDCEPNSIFYYSGWHSDELRNRIFVEKLRKFFRLRDYSALQNFADSLNPPQYKKIKNEYSHSFLSFLSTNRNKISWEKIRKVSLTEQFISDFYDQWMTKEKFNLFLRYESHLLRNIDCAKVHAQWEENWNSIGKRYIINWNPVKSVLKEVYPRLMADVLSFLDDLEAYTLEKVGFLRITSEIVEQFKQKEKEILYRELTVVLKIIAIEKSLNENSNNGKLWDSVLLKIKSYFVFLE